MVSLALSQDRLGGVAPLRCGGSLTFRDFRLSGDKTKTSLQLRGVW